MIFTSSLAQATLKFNFSFFTALLAACQESTTTAKSFFQAANTLQVANPAWPQLSPRAVQPGPQFKGPKPWLIASTAVPLHSPNRNLM